MHELSIASSIVERILAFAESHPEARVLAVRLLIGELTCVEEEQLGFCYMAITKETIIENSTLEVERMEAEVRCPHCSYQGRPSYWNDVLAAAPVATLQCPRCGQAAEAIQGHECAIKTVRYVLDSSVSAA